MRTKAERSEGVRSTWTGYGVSVMAALALVVGVGPAYGWGVGHQVQARLLLAALPAEIREFFPEEWQQRIVREFCMYPDTAQTFDEGLLGKEAVAELERVQKLNGGRLLHDDLSIALVFSLLTKAFAEKNPQHAAVWLGSLIHTIGDDGSHLSLLAYLAEMSRFPNVRMGRGLSELSQLMATETGREKLSWALAGYTPRRLAERQEEALKKLIVMAYEEMDYGAQRQSRLGGTFNAEPTPAALEDGRAAMAELGAHGVQRMLDAVVTAWAFAQRNQSVVLTESVLREGRASAEAFVATKPLEHDTVYTGTLDSRPTGPAVGVLVEPSTFMGAARFGYCGAVLLGQVMRTLRAAGIPYQPLDIRQVDKEGLPGPEKIPALIVCAGSFYAPPEPFGKYVEAGGRLLWIGGRDKGLLGKLSAALKPADTNLLPVALGYEDPNTAVVARVAIRFLNVMQNPLGAEPYRFVNNPNTFGWTTMRCGLQVRSDDPDIQMLVEVTDGTNRMYLGAALMEPARARHVFLPMYLFWPFTLAPAEPMDWGHPGLDSVGREMLLAAVRLLVPELVTGTADPATVKPML